MRVRRIRETLMVCLTYPKTISKILRFPHEACRTFPASLGPGLTKENSLDSGVDDSHYMDGPYMETKTSELEWKRVSAELLILSLVEARPRHGYEISKLIALHVGNARLDSGPMGGKERAAPATLLPPHPAGAEGFGFAASRLATVRGGR